MAKAFGLVAGGHIHRIFNAVASLAGGRGGKGLKDGAGTIAHQGVGLRQQGLIIVLIQPVRAGGDHGQDLAVRRARLDNVHDLGYALGIRVGMRLHRG